MIDKSMKPRIPTMNDILRKWCSEMSHVGKVTVLVFWRKGWILLLAPCVLLLALSDYGYVYIVTRSEDPYADATSSRVLKRLTCDTADCKDHWRDTFRIRWRRVLLLCTRERSMIVSCSWRHCGDGRPSGPLYVREGPSVVIAWVIVFMHYIGILIQLPCRRVTFYYVISAKRCYTRKVHALHTLLYYTCILLVKGYPN